MLKHERMPLCEVTRRARRGKGGRVEGVNSNIAAGDNLSRYIIRIHKND